MKRNQLIALAVGAAALLFLFLVLQDRGGPTADLPPSAHLLEEPLEPARIAAVRIATGPDAEVTLRKEGEDWMVESPGAADAPADPSWIDQLLESIEDLEEGGEVRGTNARVHDDLGVDEETGVELTLYDEDGEVLHELVVGRPNDDWSGVFVRRAGEDETLLVRTSLRQKLRLRGTSEAPKLEPSGWWKLRLHEVDAAELARVEIQGPEATERTLVREEPAVAASQAPPADGDGEAAAQPTTEPVWAVAEGEGLEDPQRLVSSFATLRATSVAAADAETGLGDGIEPAAVVRAETTEGEPLTLEIGGEVPDQEGARYVRRAGETIVYVLPGYAVKNLLDPED